MKNRLIEGALPITARLLADDLGLNLHFGAQGFASSVDEAGGKHLYIPDLPLDDALASALALGGVVHEDAHFSTSDFDALDIEDPLLRKFTYILEDVRAEVAEVRKYPGARAVLARMVAAMVTNQQFSAVKAEEGLGGALWYVLYRLRADVLGQEAVRTFAEGAAGVLKPQMPGASFSRLTAMMYEVMHCENTADCRDLATQILAMLKEEAEKPPSQSDDQDADDDQNSADNKGDQQGDAGGSDENSGEDSSGSSPEGQDDNGTDGADTGGDTGDGTEATAPNDNGQSDPAVGDPAEAMKQFLAGAGGDGASMDMGDMLASALTSISQQSNAVRLPDAIPLCRSLGHGEDVLARLRAETSAVRRRIQGLLEAKARSTIMNGRTGNRLDPKRLWRLRTGDCRVFEKRIDGHKQDTAVQLLIDRSISMRAGIQTASDAALAVALAMDGIQGVTTSVAAFPCVEKNPDDVMLVSNFGESFRKIATRFPAVGVDGYTPMAQAMLWGGYHLHASGKGRKILLVATDGQPDDREAATEVIAKLEQSGVEVMGLGIKVDVSQLFATAASISDVGEIAVALFGMLQEKLAKAA